MAKAGDGKKRSDVRRAEYRLSKRLTGAELDEFTIRARNAGFDNPQDYLSALILGDIQLDAASRRDRIQVLGQLGKIGSNINQLAKAVNQGRLKGLDLTHTHIFDDLRSTIETVGREIRRTL